MDTHTLGYLFVSYSHADKASMLTFRKHLKGILFDRLEIWTDDDIPQGMGWDNFLMKHLKGAGSALVLASPDYLASSWCRKELRQFARAHQQQHLKRVFWVQVRPCGWSGTELAQFQSWEENVAQAVSEYPDEIQRDRAVVELCKKIATAATQSKTRKDEEDLALVRRLLLEDPKDRNLTVESVIGRGDFSLVCRGRNGSDDAVIKVLMRTPIDKMADAFLRIGEVRKKIQHASFIRLHDIFPLGPKNERRTIIVSEFIEHQLLSKSFGRSKARGAQAASVAPFDVDTAATLLRRAAEGLTELHRVSAKSRLKPHESTLGYFNVDNIYYDANSKRLRLAVFGISSFLWREFAPNLFSEWVLSGSGGNCYFAPEQCNPTKQCNPGGGISHLTDQYMLGLLAIELLERKRIGDIVKRKSLEEFWEAPDAFVRGAWKDEHPQLWNVVKTLLAKDPTKRWASMALVVDKVRALEEESRALAKHAYCKPQPRKGGGTFRLEDCEAFFKQFYKAFFKTSPESIHKFKHVHDPHRKLMAAMVSILNFREGNKPTSLDSLLDRHRRRGITADEFDKFRDSFLKTMEHFTDDPRVVKAWDELFTPVVEYMKAECTESTHDATPSSEPEKQHPRTRKHPTVRKRGINRDRVA